MSESALLHSVMLRIGRGAVRLFRANCGQAWQGKVVEKNARLIIIEDPRAFHGMPEGTSDLIGWRSVEITPAMVGTRIAQFVALEIKTARGRESQPQQRFRDAVERAGGVAAVVRSEAEAEAALRQSSAVAALLQSAPQSR